MVLNLEMMGISIGQDNIEVMLWRINEKKWKEEENIWDRNTNEHVCATVQDHKGNKYHFSWI